MSAGLMVGLRDLRGLSQPLQFYSMEGDLYTLFTYTKKDCPVGSQTPCSWHGTQIIRYLLCECLRINLLSSVKQKQ